MVTYLFELRTAHDILKIFQKRMGEFKNNTLDAEKALSCAEACWAIAEWVAKEQGTSTGTFKRDLINKEPSFSLIRDLTNAFKHREITRYAPKVTTARRQRGFSPAFSDAFARPALVMYDEQDNKYYIFDTLSRCLEYWEIYLGN